MFSILLFIFTSSIYIDPDSGSRSPRSKSIKVDLPDPVGPKTAIFSPFFIFRFNWLSDLFSDPSQENETFLKIISLLKVTSSDSILSKWVFFAKSSLTFDRWGILALISLDMTKILWKAGNNFNAAIPYTDTVAKKLVKSSPALLTRTIPKTRSTKIIESIINLGICDKAKILPLRWAISKLVLSKFESTFTWAPKKIISFIDPNIFVIMLSCLSKYWEILIPFFDTFGLKLKKIIK